MILYHGTSTKYLDDILKNGIRPTDSCNWEHTVSAKKGFSYLSSVYAPYFSLNAYEASEEADNDPEEEAIYAPVIFEVDVSEKMLYPDEDFLSQVLKKHGPEYKDKTLCEINEMIDITDYKKVWRDSVNRFGNVAHKGIIKPSRIKRHNILEKEFWMDALDPSISLMNFHLYQWKYALLTRAAMGDLTVEQYYKESELGHLKSMGADSKFKTIKEFMDSRETE